MWDSGLEFTHLAWRLLHWICWEERKTLAEVCTGCIVKGAASLYARQCALRLRLLHNANGRVAWRDAEGRNLVSLLRANVNAKGAKRYFATLDAS